MATGILLLPSPNGGDWQKLRVNVDPATNIMSLMVQAPPTPIAPDLVATGTLTAAKPTGDGVEVSPGPLNITVAGGSITLGGVAAERSFDKGTTWFPVTRVDGSGIVWTGGTSTTITEPEAGVMYRLKATGTVAAAVNWRISQ